MTIKPKRLIDWIRSSPKVLTRSKRFLDGHEVEFGSPDTGKIQAEIKAHNEAGAKALKEFEDWLVEFCGLENETAFRYRKWVWNALCLTWVASEQDSDPVALLTRSDYSYATIMSMTAALKRWAIYTQDGVMLGEIAQIERTERKRPKYIVGDDPKTDETSYTEETIQGFLERLSVIRRDPRYPWGWPTISIWLKCGLYVSSELLYLSRAATVSSLETDVLYIWSHHLGSRAIPVPMVREELEYLLAMPLDWETLPDLIAPASRPSARGSGARAKIRMLIAEIYGDELTTSKATANKLRKSAMIRIWKDTRNLIAVAQIGGYKDLAVVRSVLGDHILEE